MRAKREQLAKLETLDNGKPISEALWDIVSSVHFTGKRGLLTACIIWLQCSSRAKSIVRGPIQHIGDLSCRPLFKASTLLA